MDSGFLFNKAFVLRKGVKINYLWRSFSNANTRHRVKKDGQCFCTKNRVCDREKTLPWKQKGVGSGETRYRRSCIRICTCQITKTEIAIERPAKFSYMQNRFGRRADRWQVSQSFRRVFVESKTRISDRMTKIVWPRESKLIRYEGLSISDGWQQRLSETFFDRFLMRKAWTLRLRKECRQRVWLMIHRVETHRTAW